MAVRDGLARLGPLLSLAIALVWITRDLYASVNNYDLSFLLGGGGGTLDYLLSVIFTFRDVLGDRDDANH